MKQPKKQKNINLNLAPQQTTLYTPLVVRGLNINILSIVNQKSQIIVK
jgi:hypothetical protein